MLILTRRIGESIMVGDGENKAEIMVLGIKGNQIRLGVEANKELPVHRKEVYERIQKEKEDE